ncbi:unnamed protein product [Lactuca virosa]|uniref:Uncharacterized protein n=1 Tax=Lactuca virosa TaxID=75947 RepID=A0AAU9P2L1_9ASTR|nr:unnamed protein product [Lactuca virosa]
MNSIEYKLHARYQVFVDLFIDPQRMLILIVATAFRTIGYEIEVYSLKEGPTIIDWLNYDVILTSSFQAKEANYRVIHGYVKMGLLQIEHLILLFFLV